MSPHLTFNEIVAYQRKYLSPDQALSFEQHLSACSYCTENAGLLMELSKSEPLKVAHAGAAAGKCLSVEEIIKFMTGELPFRAARKAQTHLARCEECRQKLADIMRASAPVAKSEAAAVAARSPLVIEHQLRDIERIVLEQGEPPPAGEAISKFWRSLIARLWPLQPAYAVLVLVLITATWFGQRTFRQWQGKRYLAESVELLKDAYPVTRQDLLPHGFSPGMFSDHHGADASKKTQVIERKLQKALSWDSRNREAKRALAQYSYFAHDLKRADSLLCVLLREDSSDFATWNDLGVVAAQREDTTVALSAFKKALQIQPKYEEAAHNRALLSE